MIETALATVALAWALSLWGKTDGLRERLGVYHVYDERGEPTARLDGGGLGGWLNCPWCAAVLALPAGIALRRWLAPLGLAVLLLRWLESLRPKARWWE